MKNKLQIFENKKILITGHTGFKGAWLTKILLMLGADIKGISLEPQNHYDFFNLLNLSSNINSVILDIRDFEKLNTEILKFEPDFIFHLAAQPIVKESYLNPIKTFDTNIMGTINVLETIRNINKKCTSIFITTDKVYYNNESNILYKESDRLGGYDPYSSSKACCELIIDSYRNSFFNLNNFEKHQKAIAVARAGNVIGGGDWSKDRLIPDIIKSLKSDKIIEIRNPDSIRPWQHVLDPLFGYLSLAIELNSNHQDYSKAYNFGPSEKSFSNVIDLVKQIVIKWGSGDYKVVEQINKFHETKYLMLDTNLIYKDIGWTSKLNLTKTLNMTVEWYHEFYNDPSTIIEITETQINKYFNEC
jgi:CDP-glucose 4,6-dehydratase